MTVSSIGYGHKLCLWSRHKNLTEALGTNGRRFPASTFRHYGQIKLTSQSNTILCSTDSSYSSHIVRKSLNATCVPSRPSCGHFVMAWFQDWSNAPPFPSSVCSTVYVSIVCFLHIHRRNHHHHHRKNYMYRQLVRFNYSASWIYGNTSKRSCGQILMVMILHGVVTTHLTARDCVR